jgi:hypothetical protein
MNCISVREPYATALFFGFKIQEFRNFRIPAEICAIHIPKTIDYPLYNICDFYSDVGANLTSEVCEIIFNNEKETKNFELKNGTYSIKEGTDIDKDSQDFKMLETLFSRNSIENNNNPYLTGKCIGTVEFTGHTEDHFNLNYKFANNLQNTKLFSLNKSFDMKGRLGLYKIELKE